MATTAQMFVKPAEFGYNGNQLLKRDGVMMPFSEIEVNEYLKCMSDPTYFAEKYVKIISLDKGLVPFVMYDYQKKLFKHLNSHQFSIILASRQSGKSISVVVYLLWFAVFHPEKLVAVLANKGATSREMLARITLALENLPFFLQPGCKSVNKGSIEFSNGSRIIAAATSGNSIRGLSVSLLYLDEFAFVENAATFYTSTYPVITGGKTSRVIITSTANGVGNQYHKLWESAVQGVSEYKAFRVDWWDVPGRDEKWKKSTISNTSALQFEQEFGNCLEKNSEITIRVNKTVHVIAIGKLYECLTRKNSCGLPIEEEIRLASVHWYHEPRSDQNSHGCSSSIQLEILTPSGFQKFDTVCRYWHDEALCIHFEDGTKITCAKLHRFIELLNDDLTCEVLAKDIAIGGTISGKIVKWIDTAKEGDWYYDPINVQNGQVYLHDGGILSHNSFHGTGATLINAETLLNLKAREPNYTQNDVKVYDKPMSGHSYIMVVDVAKGRGQDYSTFNVIDVTSTPFKIVAVYRSNMISPLLFPDIIYKYARTYGDAYILVESNDAGAIVCNGLYYDLEYENMFVESSVKAGAIGVTMTKRVKRIGCSNIKDLIEGKKLEIIDANTISELSTFEADGVSFAATQGNHDDLAMNLVLFGWFAATEIFAQMSSSDLKTMLYSERLVAIEEDITPVGYFTDRESGDGVMVEKDGTTWASQQNTRLI